MVLVLIWSTFYEDTRKKKLFVFVPSDLDLLTFWPQNFSLVTRVQFLWLWFRVHRRHESRDRQKDEEQHNINNHHHRKQQRWLLLGQLNIQGAIHWRYSRRNKPTNQTLRCFAAAARHSTYRTTNAKYHWEIHALDSQLQRSHYSHYQQYIRPEQWSYMYINK